jgi:hypothetical protein
MLSSLILVPKPPANITTFKSIISWIYSLNLY